MMKSNHHQYINLSVRPPSTALVFPTITAPMALGFFSINARQEFERSGSQLRYFKEPCRFPSDLNIGLSKAVQRQFYSINNSFDNMLKFLYDHHERILLSEPPEFVSCRGLLRCIMCTPYEYGHDWCIHVTRFNNTIYMLQSETPEEDLQKIEEQKKPRAWQLKFEQYCLSKNPLQCADSTKQVNECEDFSVIFKTCLAGMSLLYGAEVDGVDSEQPLQLNYDKPELKDAPFIELKIRQDQLNEEQDNTYLKQVTRDWWCQSFLVNIKDIYVGMRTSEGLMHKIERVKVASLPKNGAEKHWTPWACANFLQEFLSMVKTKTANENCPYTVYEFIFDANLGLISYERMEGITENSFIPDWYINLIKRIKTRQNIQN